MSRMLVLVAVVFPLTIGAQGCGRSELDPGFGTTNVTTGVPANDGVAGTGVGADPGGGTAGHSGSTTGHGGSGGAGGASHSPALIPCGDGACTPGTEICCVQRVNHRSRETCISAKTSCESGASIACIASSSCGAGQVCCESLLVSATMCLAPQSCLTEPGVILCGTNADCPGLAPHCCQTEGTGICAAQACPAGSGQQGPDGQGVGGPQD
jgi:hypothetical protein